MVSRKIGCGLLVVAATLLSAGSLAAREPACEVTYDDGRLTLHAEKEKAQAQLRQVQSEIAELQRQSEVGLPASKQPQ